MIHTFSISYFCPPHLPKTLPICPPTVTVPSTDFLANNRTRKITSNQIKKWVRQSSDNPTVMITSPPDDVATGIESASSVVRKFYQGINRRDLASVEPLIANNCVYEDLVFPRPFVGREAIVEFFKKFIDSISTDLQFAIDDISEEDTSAIGVTWHLEWNGKTFPFSKGCSFYRLEVINGQRQIVYGRDSVEPAIKPGETALVAIRGVAWLLQKFPNLADRL
ncbi:Polyketide cyclase -like domain [Olea europaea subsp. europaea]|uniref:Polyketide cyclase -like domain n=1 Tax=Olea europaea subsp. europaea TaxID=158383 RepID=A0A8S0RZ51_OLEEU|nr:Polyketide cyclase -like domain [Olea europaea subsp. europaea]